LKPIGADVKSLGKTTAKYGDELLVLGTALLGAATAFKAVAAATALFNLALSANPVVIAVAAIAALIAGLVAAYQRFEGVRNVVDAVWHAIRDAFQAAAPVVVDFVQGAWQALVDAFNAVAPVVQRMYESVVGVLTTLWQWIDANVVPTITAGIELIIAVFNRVAPVVQYVAQVVFDVMTTVRNIITSFVAAVWPIIEGFLATLVTAFQIGWTVLKNIVQGALNQIKIVIETVLGVIRGIFQFFTGLLNGDFSKAWQGLKTIASSAINGIKDTVGNVLRQVYDIFVGVWDAIVAFFRGIPGRISDIAGGMFNGIKNAFREAINFIIRGWNRLEFAVPGFKIGPIGYDGFTLGLPHIPELAKGGIVTSPTLAVIGEAGPEAVVPLSKYRMDGGSNGSTINLTVNAGMGADGTRIGQEIVRELLKYQRQNGALPLKVA
jgi:phage-related protein